MGLELDTIIASLEKGYNQLKSGTLQTSAEITAARRAEITSGAAPDLVNRWFWTANICLYRQTEQGLQYGIGQRQAFNAIAGGVNIDRFCRHLRDDHNYPLTPKQIEQIASLDDIAWVSPDNLKLQGTKQEWRYLEINPKRHADLNPIERALAQVAFGTEDFEQNMQMLAEAGKTPRIYVLDPDYVKEKVKQGQAIARACWLYSFDNYSDFDASNWVVSYISGLRGVRREQVREADAPQKLVSLEERKLHTVLSKYLNHGALERAKEDIAELYR